jgi:hypothetical protein
MLNTPFEAGQSTTDFAGYIGALITRGCVFGRGVSSRQTTHQLLCILQPKSGVKFTVFVQICPRIWGLLSKFMQQSVKFHESSFSLSAVSTCERDAVSSLPAWQ